MHEPAPLPAALQQRVEAALLRMNAEGYFHHDVVLGSTKGGTAPVPTIVRRILVGEPGITYKYLGLRIFAHPWRLGSEAGGDNSCLDGAAVVGELNAHLQKETARLLASQQQQTGCCTFNLTLINLLEEHEARRGLQPRASQAATPCIPGCNPVHPGLQPRASRAATPCIPGCNPVHPQAATPCIPRLQPRASPGTRRAAAQQGWPGARFG